MVSRFEELSNLKSYIETIDKEMTLILQSLQWDDKHILQSGNVVTCKYDRNHRLLEKNRISHEAECYTKCQGYWKGDKLLPDPLDTNATTLIKLGKDEIKHIIDTAAKGDHQFRRGMGGIGDCEPLSLQRLQCQYSSDERRAIHDAVVSATPSYHHLLDLDMPNSHDGSGQEKRDKSRAEILAELRDMKRRRTKYRGATRSSNHSHVLRDLIAAQMELYTGAIAVEEKTVEVTNRDENSKTTTTQTSDNREKYRSKDDRRSDYYRIRERSDQRHSKDHRHDRTSDYDKTRRLEKPNNDRQDYSRHDKYYKEDKTHSGRSKADDYDRRSKYDQTKFKNNSRDKRSPEYRRSRRDKQSYTSDKAKKHVTYYDHDRRN